MDIKDRIVYSPTEILLSVENTLKKLDTFRYDGQYRTLLGEDFVSRLSNWEEIIRKRKDDPFTLTVIGDFKRGKSTFINALLGEEVATTDVTTETVTLNRISYGATENVAVLAGSKRIMLSDDELKRDRLEEVLRQSDEAITTLELKRPNELLKNLTIIDTPGMNDALQDFEELARKAIMDADAVVYIYNVHYPLSLSEQMFLRAAVIPQKYTKLYIVGNYSDTLNTVYNYERAHEFLEERVLALFPDAEAYMLSSFDELCRKLNEKSTDESERSERPCEALSPILEKQFAELRASICKLVEDKKEFVTSDRTLRLAKEMIRSLNVELDMIENGLNMSQSDAQSMLENVQKEKEESIEKQEKLRVEVKELILSMKEETTAWMMDFLDRMEGELPKLRGESTETLLKYYEFYCIDLIQNALDTCVDYHREILYDKFEKISLEMLEEMVKGFNTKKKYSVALNLDNKIWTKGDTVAFAAGMLSNMGALGAVAGLIGTVAAGIMRQPEVKARSGEFVEQIEGKIKGLSRMVTSGVTKTYSDISDSAQKLITEYYADEVAETERMVNQSVAVAHIEDERKAEIRSAVSKARAILDECISNIQ